jgi:hypothetical protein
MGSKEKGSRLRTFQADDVRKNFLADLALLETDLKAGAPKAGGHFARDREIPARCDASSRDETDEIASENLPVREHRFILRQNAT